ncbi:methyl-accepting chemotaxis protein [Metallibacterium sp.]|uniref:methyl-accepting chemotaxis protein n=1 Tax=Metallibacterium sp. TaxID=2940281 RepID=UPI002627C7CD|nr:methyl-accepting chemotaxis protein [Metallibacterium sp.]
MSATSNVIGKERSNTIWIVLLLLSIALAVIDFGWLTLNSKHERDAANLTTQIQVLSQSTAKFALESASGNLDSFKELDATRATLDNLIRKLKNGDPDTGMPGYGNASAGVGPAITALDKSWAQLDGDLTKILRNKELVLDSKQQTDAFTREVPVLDSRMDQVASIVKQGGGSANQTYTVVNQMLLGDRMIRRALEVQTGGEDAQTAADGLARDAQLYGAVLSGLIQGNSEVGVSALPQPAARNILGTVNKGWQGVSDPLNKLLAAAPTLVEVKQAANQASVDSQSVLLRASDVSTRLDKLPLRRPFPNVWLGALGAAGAILFALLLVFAQSRAQKQRLAASGELNQRNQEAILRLLDEMGSLAEGDLTVRATVTEDITGAIADSVNFAVEALRSLVSTINETAVQVSAAAQETQATATHLAEAAEHQAQQITSASAAINEMAVSIDEVSKNSSESVEVALRSVQIAGKGAAVVRQTIAGMDAIRDQIQETSKRIKRLGESSQEIGSIVELINDIAEQTNILALNAAIQAASAGEAGRGFAVVADEVQRLAERSATATKRIETLVQAIQSDTNEAVNSMEQTTAEVVTGARRAEDAGAALGEIEKVSNDLADLIQNISEAARQQSAAATNISSTMNVIQEITSQTSTGASQTAESIGNLAQMAQDLRRSVADFKLPG